MPTYDYVCDACEHSFELFQSMSSPPEKKCPECRRRKLRRLIGPGAAIVFKGSGFYKTDYRSESYKKAAAAEKSSSSGNSTGSDSGKTGSDSGKTSSDSGKTGSDSGKKGGDKSNAAC